MSIPDKLIQSLQGLPGFDQQAFTDAHAKDMFLTSLRVNPAKRPVSLLPGTEKSPVPWSAYGYYLAQRPSFTFDPLFHAGCYYVQEASSMFLEQALRQVVDLDKPLRILDLSAAPGGKSTHIQSLISTDSLLVSNEVIRSRANTLRDNIIKWGSSNVIVTHNDPRDFSRLENFFDVIVVDAPCSGSGLFRREPEAIENWSENNVQLCAQRQQRIVADVWPALKTEGILIYSTCSYSKEEDEEITDWMIQSMNASGIELQVEEKWGIEPVKTSRGGWGYRFWPHRLQGEGFYLAAVKKNDDSRGRKLKTKSKQQELIKSEKDILMRWMDTNSFEFVKYQNTVYAWPASLAGDLQIILSEMRTIYSGTLIGDLLRNKLIPEHAFALSATITARQGSISLDLQQAIAYLQRKDLQLANNETGWKRVLYEGFSLGWINILSNRINNYYPKELRILKDI